MLGHQHGQFPSTSLCANIRGSNEAPASTKRKKICPNLKSMQDNLTSSVLHRISRKLGPTGLGLALFIGKPRSRACRGAHLFAPRKLQALGSLNSHASPGPATRTYISHLFLCHHHKPQFFTPRSVYPPACALYNFFCARCGHELCAHSPSAHRVPLWPTDISQKTND